MAQQPYRGRIGVIDALVQLLHQHQFAGEEIAGIRDVIVSRWSKKGDVGEAAEQASRTLAAFADDPRVGQVIDLGTAPFDSAVGRAEHRVVPIAVGDIYDLSDIADGLKPPPASERIGYLLIHGDLAVLRVAYSGSIAGAIYDRRGEPTNVYTEALIQLLKAVRWQQERLAIPWRTTELNIRFSDDFSRTGRFQLESTRMFRWLGQLHVDWWLGAQKQLRGAFSELINALRAHDAESKGQDSTKRTNEGIVDHLVYPERAPKAETALPVWRRHVRDSKALDGRARSTGDDRGKGSLLAEWDVDVVPAVRAWLQAYAAGASHNELAALCVAHQVPTTPAGKTVGPRRATMDQLPWPVARRRAANLLLLNNEPRRLDPVDPDDPKRGVIERTNAYRLTYLDAARHGVERATHRVPATAGTDLETFGRHQHRVVRDHELDTGYVVVPRTIGWPPAYTTTTEQRTITVPLGTFPRPSRVLGLVEMPVSDTEAEVVIEVEVLDEPVVDDDGSPVEWVRLGIDDDVYEQIIDRLQTPRNDGGRTADTGHTANVLPDIADHPLVEDGVEMQVHVRAMGPWTARGRELWMRPAKDAEGGWRLADKRAVVDDEGNRRYLLDGRDITSWRRAYIAEPALLRSVVEAFVDQAGRAFDGDVEVVLPVPVDDGRASIDVRRRQLERQRDAAVAAAEQYRQDTEGQDLVVGRRLRDGDEPGADQAEQLAKKLRSQADDQDALVADLDRQLADLESEADQSRETVLDERWLSHFAALLQQLAARDRDTPGAVPGDLLVVRHICERVFTDWRFSPPDAAGYVHWTCVAKLDTLDGQHVELELAGKVANTADRAGWGERETQRLLEQIFADGVDLDDTIGQLHRSTSRSAVIKTRIYPTLGEHGVPARKKAALLDHPHAVARQAFWAASGRRPDVIDWTPGYEQWVHEVFTTAGTWARSACPTDITDVQIIAACLAQHPGIGVEIGELEAKTGISVDRIRTMINPPLGGRGHIRRPAYFRWASEGIVGMHPCPHDDCPAETAWASIVVLLPETNPQPGDAGGVLCPDCLRLPIDTMSDVRFPDGYRTLVTGPTGNRGSIIHQQVTVLTSLPAIPTVAAPAGLSVAQLSDETGLPRAAVQRILADTGLTPQRRRRAGRKVAAVYDAHAARHALAVADVDMAAYGPDALTIGRAAEYAGVSRGELSAATDAGEVTVRYDGRRRRRWLTGELDAWQQRHAAA